LVLETFGSIGRHFGLPLLVESCAWLAEHTLHKFDHVQAAGKR